MIAKFHRSDLVICSHSRKEKTLSYTSINMAPQLAVGVGGGGGGGVRIALK